MVQSREGREIGEKARDLETLKPNNHYSPKVGGVEENEIFIQRRNHKACDSLPLYKMIYGPFLSFFFSSPTYT